MNQAEVLTKPGDSLELVFDSKLAKGTIRIERCDYGVYIYLPHVDDDPMEPMVLVDLYYNAPQGKGSTCYPNAVAAIHVWSPEHPCDDPEAKVVYNRVTPTTVETREP